MRETKKCYTLNPDEYQNLMVRFEITDGPDMLHSLREEILGGDYTVEVELTIRYVKEAKK